VVRCVPGNAYILKTLLGEEFSAAINGRYLKKYYPSIEIDRRSPAVGLHAFDTGNIRRSRTRPPLEQKIHKQKERPVPKCIAVPQNYITTASCWFTSNNPGDQDFKEVGSRRRGERSESMIQSFLCFFGCSLFSCSKTTVTATWKARE
jgi:hypothetical protein